MQLVEGRNLIRRKGFPEQVKRQASGNVGQGAHAIDRLLHFAVTAIAAFDRIGRSAQQTVVQEDERLFEIGREQTFQDLAQGREAVNFLA